MRFGLSSNQETRLIGDDALAGTALPSKTMVTEAPANLFEEREKSTVDWAG
jgi:hypothetical protein